MKRRTLALSTCLSLGLGLGIFACDKTPPDTVDPEPEVLAPCVGRRWHGGAQALHAALRVGLHAVGLCEPRGGEDDVGQLCGQEEMGLLATDDSGVVMRGDTDVVVYCGTADTRPKDLRYEYIFGQEVAQK